MKSNLAHKQDSESGLGLAPDAANEARAEFAAQFIPAGSRVLDLGCGATALRRFLPMNCTYQGVDAVASDDVVACDFNAGDFPSNAADADLVVMLGLLECLTDVEGFFNHLRFARRDVVLTYRPTDLDKERDGFANHLSFYDLALLFDRYGFRIECTAPLSEHEVIMRLTPVERFGAGAPCSVAVISASDSGNFGDRLGIHNLNALFPGEADVHHLTFGTLSQARERYDLVVLGTGNSLFAPLLSDELVSVLERGKAAIGIFGTQYRELIPRPAFDRVLDRLDTWYASHEDDVLLYGRGRANVVHLGNWLIEQFPLTKPTEDEPLQVDDGVLEMPLDRVIQIVQSRKNVFSTRMAPFLCALTSAEIAAYAEQPSKDMPGIVSGKFRGLLIDVFGRSFPERKFFIVDREAVARYKARVHRNVAQLREKIAVLLQDTAAAA